MLLPAPAGDVGLETWASSQLLPTVNFFPDLYVAGG